MSATPRIGFCCRFVAEDPVLHRAMNPRFTTVAALLRLERTAMLERALEIVAHNGDVLLRQLAWLAARPPLERLFRLESKMLPAATHPATRWIYAEPVMRELVEDRFARAGALARDAGVRLSSHPGPYTVLGTVGATTRANSVQEVELHADMMRWLGLAEGARATGAHIAVHVGSRAAGLDGFRAALTPLSREARGLVAVENDEGAFGLPQTLELADELPLVLDLHHHWIAGGGEYLEPDDPRIARVVASWGGRRPVAHVSQPEEDLLAGHPPDRPLDYATLVASGIAAHKLCAHSRRLWNRPHAVWAARHLAWADLEVEAKAKNLAAADLVAAADAHLGGSS